MKTNQYLKVIFHYLKFIFHIRGGPRFKHVVQQATFIFHIRSGLTLCSAVQRDTTEGASSQATDAREPF